MEIGVFPYSFFLNPYVYIQIGVFSSLVWMRGVLFSDLKECLTVLTSGLAQIQSKKVRASAREADNL